MKWGLIPNHPICKIIDFHDHFDMKTNFTREVGIMMTKIENASVTVQVEERVKKMGRTFKSLGKSYTGPLLEFRDLNITQYKASFKKEQAHNTYK